MIEIPVTVVDHMLNLFLERLFRRILADELTDLHRSLEGFHIVPQAFRQRRCRHQRLTRCVIDDLRVDVLRAPIDRQPGTLGGPVNFLADAGFLFLPAVVLFILNHIENPYGKRNSLNLTRVPYLAAVAAALPALRLMYSPSYFTPLP